MASMNGGQRFTVSSSAATTALNACAGIALSQSGSPAAAGVGAGRIPSSSFGHLKVSASRSSAWDIVFAGFRPPDRSRRGPERRRIVTTGGLRRGGRGVRID
jgi:hypothetical protein